MTDPALALAVVLTADVFELAPPVTLVVRSLVPDVLGLDVAIDTVELSLPPLPELPELVDVEPSTDEPPPLGEPEPPEPEPELASVPASEVLSASAPVDSVVPGLVVADEPSRFSSLTCVAVELQASISAATEADHAPLPMCFRGPCAARIPRAAQIMLILLPSDAETVAEQTCSASAHSRLDEATRRTHHRDRPHPYLG
ncbi:MAG TPA: hypothetical protein VI197_30365 [Polyangiaceae bacterium]